ncbi:TLR adapter interacting with SLC15A4 on the lysosome [Stigmatopora nigra]
MAYEENEESCLLGLERQETTIGCSSSSTSHVVPPHCDPLDGSFPEASQVESTDLRRTQSALGNSPGIQISSLRSAGDATFLVPSFCRSICKNYSDLHIGGDQVLPLSANFEHQIHVEVQAPPGPFLQLCDVPPPGEEDSLPRRSAQIGLLLPFRGGSNHWRNGSGRDRSFFLQGRDGPFTNSLLNNYLEQKLLDLYQQYMMEKMARNSGSVCPLLASEMVMTSLDQITLQLSREGNLDAGVAKGMLLSCLMRVAGEVESSEISTPVLQISSDTSKEDLNQYKEQ